MGAGHLTMKFTDGQDLPDFEDLCQDCQGW